MSENIVQRAEDEIVRVIHKVRAYIDGIVYGPGDEASIAAKHFNPEVHTLVQPTPAAEGGVKKPEGETAASVATSDPKAPSAEPSPEEKPA